MALFSKRHYEALARFCSAETQCRIIANEVIRDTFMSNDAILRLAWILRDDNPAFDLIRFMDAATKWNLKDTAP